VKVSIIFSTYNSTDWLEKVIWGFYFQSFKDFEIVIADDGSTEETENTIDRLRKKTLLEIKHVWQPDEGFQKCKILNKAILATTGDYIIFTDGDCIPRYDFVQAHVDNAKPCHLLSGGYFKLPMKTSQAITKKDIEIGNAFNPNWLLNNGLKKSHKIAKLTAQGWKQRLYNALTPTKATWNGHNASTWKSLLLEVNGFDERMQYGGEDRELGERLINLNVSPIQIRYSAICLHLDHARGYVSEEGIKKNKHIRKITKEQKITRTSYGIA